MIRCLDIRSIVVHRLGVMLRRRSVERVSTRRSIVLEDIIFIQTMRKLDLSNRSRVVDDFYLLRLHPPRLHPCACTPALASLRLQPCACREVRRHLLMFSNAAMPSSPVARRAWCGIYNALLRPCRCPNAALQLTPSCCESFFR